MSQGSLPSHTQNRNQTNQARGKWVVVALLVVALIGILLARSVWKAPTVGVPPVIEEPTLVATQPVATQIAETTNESSGVTNALNITPVAPPVAIQEPLVLNAVIGYDADGNEFLTISGSADARCNSIRFLLDGMLIGVTTPDADGGWALTSNQLPTVGNHISELECEADNGIYTAAPRAFELPNAPEIVSATEPAPVIESPSAAPTEPVGSDGSAETPATESDPATNPDDNQTETEAETTAEETEAPQPTANTDQPTVAIAQDLSKYVGGPLLLRGDAKADQIVEVIFDNGQTKLVDTARANAEGQWHYRGILTEPGVYAVTAQLPGTVAESSAEVTVSADIIFGSKGDCLNKIPPYGSIEGDQYIINYCEYFSLVATRLGISFAELRAANQQLINLDYLKQGDVLNIPIEP